MAAIPANSRLQKHVQTLSALTEAESLSTQNNEDAVSEFDDRLKRAEGKHKVILSILGETAQEPSSSAGDAGAAAKRATRRVNGNMEDFAVPQPRPRT